MFFSRGLYALLVLQLCQQWLIVAKKVAFKIIKLNTYKIKNDKAAKV